MSASTHSDPTFSKPPQSPSDAATSQADQQQQQQQQKQQKQPPLLIGLSGPTSSGKTTLATSLASVFASFDHLTVHADDFYKPDSQIPTKHGMRDWDCAESLDLTRFHRVLLDIKHGGTAPADLVRQGGGLEADGVHGVMGPIGAETIDRWKTEVEGWPDSGVKRRTVVVVDGFLLFGRSVPRSLQALFDVKVLLRVGYGDAKRRRESRNGYVTLEGFWHDPPGYFDRIVWPNFLAEHEHILVPGEGGIDGAVGEDHNPGEEIYFSEPQWTLEECLEWIIGVMKREMGIPKA